MHIHMYVYISHMRWYSLLGVDDTNKRIRVCLYTHTHVYTYICIYLRWWYSFATRIHDVRIHTRMYIHIYAYITCIYIHMYTSQMVIFFAKRIHDMCIHTHMYIHTYAYIAHVYTYICVHIRRWYSLPSGIWNVTTRTVGKPRLETLGVTLASRIYIHIYVYISDGDILCRVEHETSRPALSCRQVAPRDSWRHRFGGNYGFQVCTVMCVDG